MSDLILAATDRPLPLVVKPIDDERVPAGMIGLASYLDDRLIARCAVAPEVLDFIEANGLFAEPVRLVLAAQEESPGLQCRLFAVVSVTPPPESEEEPEPWAASVPGAGFESEVEREPPEAGGPEGEAIDGMEGMLFLGQIVRFDRDRVHPDNLGLEAADVLRKLVEGRTSEVVDRALDDLLNGGGPA